MSHLFKWHKCMETLAKQALAGLRVVEYSDFVHIPYAGKLFADLGAEVIKIELPGKGDSARQHGPFPDDLPDPEKSGLSLYLNTNKLGITLDLRVPEARAVLLRLLGQADVFLHSIPKGTFRRWRLSHRQMWKQNAQLVVTSVTPFGWTGPYRDFKGSDLIAFQGSGLGHRYFGVPDREPLRGGSYFASYLVGINAATGTLLALFGRDVIGKGQHVDISEQDCLAVPVLGYQLVSLFYDRGYTNVRAGNAHRAGAPAALLPCKDGYVFVYASEPHMWEGFRKAMGDPEWASLPAFQGTFAERAEYGDELYALMQPWLMERTKEEIFQLLQAHKSPSTPAYTTKDLLENDHLKERGFWETVNHPVAGQLTVPGAPYKLSVTPWQVKRPAPLLGQHTKDILCGRLGYSSAEFARLRRAGAI